MVERVYSEKKESLAVEAKALRSDLESVLGIKGIKKLRIINRYDAENISHELFCYAKSTVFSEPQLDIVTDSLTLSGEKAFAVESLPGQFDQRAQSAAECIGIISQKERPTVRSAKVYVIDGDISESDFERIKKYVINPVESREASMEKPDTLKTEYPDPGDVEVLDGFTSMKDSELLGFIKKYSLAMDENDLKFCREYFRGEKREPTITEIRVIDTYWSDHCRHTTFLTEIENASFDDEFIESEFKKYLELREELGIKKPVCLMDMATVAVKYLKKKGLLPRLDESEEINACTVKIDITADGKKEPWLLLFKNETHNHPTEIEPFGGAATCIGGAIRDPLSGRSYVYGAMRVTGAADPLKDVSETIPGKLPQRKIVTGAAAGYSSYGNQIGLATGIVDEIYHDGYAAKRMEIGAVIAAAPEKNVRRVRPEKGDAVILLGGATGRDGCGGATGSSKSHNSSSLETCGAEVQKGNAPEERKLQRLFRNPEASLMIKRCNDFGAGGVSVAVGELADGLLINLDLVPKKYEGLSGTELAISESQERMAVVVDDGDVDAFLRLAESENIRAVKIASVTDDERLTMTFRGKKIVDLSRKFIDSNGAPKKTDVKVKKAELFALSVPESFTCGMKKIADDLNTCSKRGLSECFDSTIGAGTVLMPYGGKYQKTPVQAMVQKISTELKETDDCSFMAFGFNPFVSEKSPYHGAYLAVIESVSKLIASGADFNDVYLTFQEYFPRPGSDPEKWGLPAAAMLGALSAQTDLGIASIGGKDSMSGTYEDISVPPTLVSFAVTTGKTGDAVSPEFKRPGNKIAFLRPEYKNGLPEKESFLSLVGKVTGLLKSGKAVSCYTPGMGGAAEAVMKMCMGNNFGARLYNVTAAELFSLAYGSFILEGEGLTENVIGEVTKDGAISFGGESVLISELTDISEAKLESIFPANSKSLEKEQENLPGFSSKPFSCNIKTARPKVLIPVFPGTNCEYESKRAAKEAGADAEIFIVRNLTGEMVKRSTEEFSKKVASAQMIFIPGGFSGGDEPEGSGKFITAFFRNGNVKEAVTAMLDKREGLMCGICNGFQALIKLGLVPYGRITETDESSPTLTYNLIGRHRSKIVRTKIVSNKSPWLSMTAPGEIYSVPVSHGEGRFLADEALIKKLSENGQIATQYVDLSGDATGDIAFNPNGSVLAVEGITSPDGRVFGKMGHSERIGKGLYKNVPGEYNINMFRAAVRYFK